MGQRRGMSGRDERRVGRALYSRSFYKRSASDLRCVRLFLLLFYDNAGTHPLYKDARLAALAPNLFNVRREAVAAPGHSLYELRPVFAQHAPQQRYVLRQIVLLDERVRPDLAHQ